jgi:hypothetical protein
MLIIVHCKAITYVKIILKSISLHIDVLQIKLVWNTFNQNYLFLL